MASPRSRRLSPLPVLLGLVLIGAALPGPASAGPLVRRAQERRACQEFAGKLQQASGNPAMAQQVYQQGVLQLVQRFGENPCGDIPAPTASSGSPGAPATTPAAAAPTGSAASTAAPATPASSSAAGSTTGAAAAPATSAASAQQQQACQQFAGKLQASAASGGAAAAQQTYAMGLQKLTGMFGSNPCPGVRPPQ